MSVEHRQSCRHRFGALIALALTLSTVLIGVDSKRPAFAATPVAGDLLINEYSSDNDANGNDFLELLTLTDSLDLRGLRISDNELVSGVLNNNESVFVFGTDAFLSSVPRGTTIALWSTATGITADTTADAGASDWSMTLVPGTGFSVTTDGLGGSTNAGLSTGGEAMYAYLPGPDLSSAGSDNVYLDFMSFEGDGGDAPAGLTDINLTSVADNAYFTGSTAAAADVATNWVKYDFPATNGPPTPGAPNPTQDLSALRTAADAAPTVTSTTPANTGTLAPGADLSVTFSENVNVGSAWFQIACTSGVRTIGDTVVSGGPLTFAINPNADLVANDACRLEVTASEVTDQDVIDPPNAMAANLSVEFTVVAAGPVNTAPTISPLPVAPVGYTLGDTAPIVRSVTVADTETPVVSLTVGVASSNSAVATAVVSGTGASRDVTVTPVGVGTASLTITVTDGGLLTAQTTMNVAVSAAEAAGTLNHYGVSDASTALDLGGGAMVVADDETNVLRIYDRAASRLPSATFDLVAGGLALPDVATREVDIEAAFRTGNTIYWLGSHGQSSGGSTRLNRQLLFTTTVTGSGSTTTFSIGGSYRSLRADMVAWDSSNGHGLGVNALGLATAATVAPEPNGINIEGAELAPDGSTMLLGFRAPLQSGKALVVPVTNPSALVAANPTTGVTAAFGAPILLDLGGRGVRDIRRNSSGDYLVVAGPSGTGSDFRLYSWNGTAAGVPVLRTADLSDLAADGSIESIVETPSPLTASSQIQLLTDSGDTIWYGNGTINKELTTTEFRKVRSALVPIGAPPVTITKIHAIQGTGSAVVAGTFTIEGIVVGDFQTQGSGQLRGFFVQEDDADADANAATSEGIFVFCETCPTAVALGDRVSVTGASSDFFQMSQLSATTAGSVSVVSSGDALPAAAAISLPVPGVPTTDLAAATTAINAYFEAFEGMRTTVPGTLSVVEHFEVARYGQIVLAQGQRPRQFTHANAPSAAGLIAHTIDRRTRTIILDDADNRQNRPIDIPNTPYSLPAPGLSPTNRYRAGDTVANLTGVLHWSFAGQTGTDAWRIRPIAGQEPAFTSTNPAPATPPAVGGSLRVASFNVLNYFLSIDTTSSTSSGACGPGATLDCRGADSAAELAAQRVKLTEALRKLDADVIGLMEMENTTGVDPLAAIVSDLNAVVGPGTYASVNTGVVGTDAIRVGIIYKPSKVSPVGAHATLTSAIDPDFDDTRNRPALAQTFSQTSNSGRFTVVVNHLKSKGSGCGTGDDDTTTGQGNCNGTRTKAAQALARWLATDPTGSADTDVLIIGDLNSYAKEDPITALITAGFTDMVAQFGGANAYGYLFDGQLGYLDHALANSSLRSQVTGVGEWHINADEIALFDYNDATRDTGESSFEEESDAIGLGTVDERRTSDHDPVLIGLELSPPAPQLERLYPTSVVPPSSIAIGAAYAVETSQRINFSCAGSISGISWFRIAQDTGTNTVTLWRNGQIVARAAGDPGATGWVSISFATPVAVGIGDQLIVSVHRPQGAYGYRLNGFTNRSVVSPSACMRGPATTPSAPNGQYRYTATPALANLSYLASEYFISPDFTPGATPPPPPPPASSARLYGADVVPPSSIAIGAAYAVTTSQRINFSCAGRVDGIWWYRTAQDTGAHTVLAWRNATLVAQGVGNPTTVGWVYVPFASPVQVTGGDRLVLGVHHPNGAYGFRLNGFTNRTVQAGCLSSPATTALNPNGQYRYTATPALPNLSYLASEYFISPDFVEVPPAVP